MYRFRCDKKLLISITCEKPVMRQTQMSLMYKFFQIVEGFKAMF